MILFPPAKINLGLHILFKREDEFHELETAMTPIPFTDILEILPSKTFKFKQTGIPIPGETSSNLCVKAYELMKAEYQIPPIYIHLKKIIPMGGGLGGGSSDAAYILNGINALFNLNISDVKLEELASRLGSDCPFFVKNVSQIAKGHGEILSPIEIDLKGYFLKIINIGLHVGTKEAYAGAQFSTSSKTVSEIISQPITTWKTELTNDFEKTVFKLYPELNTIKENLYLEGAIYAAMSGSGSTMYGIFEKKPNKSDINCSKILELIVEL